MKGISVILASILCAGAPVIAEDKASEPTTALRQENNYQLGSAVIAQLRAAYLAGEYDEFLTEMDDAYNSAKKENELEGLIEIRTEAGKYSVPQEKLIQGFESIQKEKNSDLLKAVAESQDSLFVQKVRSAAAQLPGSTQEAMITLSSLRSKAPGSGMNSDENKLIEIDLENHYKVIHLDSLVAMGQSIPDRKEKQFILEMQKMDRMVAAAKDFNDQKLKSAVESAVAGQDARLVKMYDMNDLNALAKGRVKPQTALEEQVATIVGNAHGKFADLNRDLLTNQAQKDQEVVQK